MALPATYAKTLATADPDGIALSQTPLAAGDLVLTGAAFVTGGVANLTTQRRVLITPAGADAGRTFTIYGTNQDGNAIVEAVAGANNPSTSASTLDFKTVTRVAVDAATAGAITVGTNGVGSTPWYVVNDAIQPVNVGIGIVISGSVSGDIEYTYDNPNSGDIGLRNATAATSVPTVYDHSILNTVTATIAGSLAMPVRAIRWTTNSGTGTATVTFIQAGIAGP